MEKLLRVTPGKSLFLFVCWWVLSTILGSILISLVGTGTVGRLRCAIVIQDIFVFVLPVLLTMVIASVAPLRVIGIDRKVSVKMIVMITLVAIVSIPAMNNIVAWNEAIHLPESWQGLETVLRNSENAAKATVEGIMQGTSVGDLVVSVLIMGVLTGFAEELFFRGGLQPLLAFVMRNRHAAVWATAFIFSAVHLQFFGFFPRLLMGAFFGYLVLWSGSIWSSVFAHALNNSLVVINFWLINKGVVSADANNFATGGSAFDVTIAVVSALATAALIYLISRQTSCDRT
ncbi:MAG: CPBP family intramembrane metalloprotease [Candidatus Homeothermus sp.]|nr:CPBP family intramembrane metalloprotease [Candidatus Homeothermus sp.]